MTFLNLQDRVMARVNRTSTEARTRIMSFLNERVRALQSSAGLARTRGGTVTLATVSGNNTLTTTGLVKITTASIPAQNVILGEVSFDTIRAADPAFTLTGVPRQFAVKTHGATSLGLILYPKPDAIYSVQLDGLLVGSDMSNDSDIPGLPDDFHDAIELGALSDEYAHDEKTDMALHFDARFKERTRELRYFMAKSAYLTRRQNDRSVMPWWVWVQP